MQQVLIDSNILVALIDSKDVFHCRAKELMQKLDSENYEIYYSDILLNEVLSVLARRCEQKRKTDHFKKLSEQFFDYLENKPLLCLYELVSLHFKNINAIMVQHHGIFNFHDALIILFLQQVPEVALATFDLDFQKCHLTILPAPHPRGL